MAISTVEFAEGWERWKKDKEFADTSPQAYSDYLESQHAIEQITAIQRVLDKNYADKADAYLDIETIVATEYGDTWVSSFLISIPEVETETEWPSDDTPVTDDPDYTID